MLLPVDEQAIASYNLLPCSLLTIIEVIRLHLTGAVGVIQLTLRTDLIDIVTCLRVGLTPSTTARTFGH